MVEGRAFPEVTALCEQRQVPVAVLPVDTLAEVIDPEVARGIVAQASPPRLFDLEDLLVAESPRTRPASRRLLVALDGVVDPRNLGAILRSAEFFGAIGVFWAQDRAVGLTPAAVRASAGASERVRIAVVGNLARALESCKRAEYWVVGTVVDDGRSLRDQLSEGLPEDLVIVLGSEGKGLRRLTRERCDLLVRLEGAGELGSLNVSAAAAATLFALA